MQDSHPLIGGRRPNDRSRAVQLTATTLRQLRQAVRKPCSLCIETLLPVIFVLLFAWLSTLTHNDHYQAETFENPPRSLAETVQWVACIKSDALLSNPTTLPLQSLVQTCDSSNFVGSTLVCGTLPILNNTGLCFVRDRADGLRWFTEPKNITTIPSLDYILLAHQLAIAAFGPIKGKLINNQASNSILGEGRIYMAPDASAAAHQLEGLLSASKGATLWKSAWFGGFLESQDQAFNYLSSNEGAGKAVALITVNAFQSDNVNVALAFNKSCIVWPTINTDRFTGGAGWAYKQYFGSGFLSLEKAILYEFNQLTSNPVVDTLEDNMAMGPMPYPDYVLNNFLTIAGTMAPLGLCLGYLYAVSQIAKRLVEEKELRLREAMAAMGMSKTLILVSWMIFFFTLNFVTATLCTIILKGSFVKHSDASVLWIMMMLFSMTTSALGGLISSFFSKSRTASIASPILFFAFSIPSFALGDSASAGEIKPLSLLSPTAFATALKLVFQYELNTGIGWNDLNNPNDDVTLGFCLFIMIFDLVAYLFLTWYLDNVLGGDWGVRQHPCFCFLNCFNCKTNKYSEDNLVTPGMDQPANAPRTLSGVSEQYPVNSGSGNVPAVVFENVNKSFGSGLELRRAVTNYNLKIFSGMVTAVLGHNGAGKTTLFNMLTGMLPVTSGDCFIYGASITTDRDEARSHIGMCPQHNILWDDLTCFEHLRYFAWVKGTPYSQCADEAERMLQAVDLAEKRNALSASLSGGQKRKLSVAIAFIGGSELVLLDEPTAGMDVHTRRHTWDLIQKMAREEKRTIILTTHFMDEAELLGDRVAMMTAGQLHSYGTTTFLKSRLGEGYTLAIQYATQPTEETRQNVKRLVQTVVASVRDKESRGREQFLVLPMDQVEHFARLLHTIEANKAQHGIVSVSMTVATIEDVFVKIATEDEAHPEAAGTYGVLAAVKNEASDSERKLALRNASFTRESVSVVVDEKVSAAAIAAQTIADVRVERPGFFTQLGGLLKKRFNIARRDTRAMVLQLVLPLLCILLAMALATLGPPSTHDTLMDVHALPDPQSAATLSCGDAFNTALKGLNLEVTALPSNATAGTDNLVDYLLTTANKHGNVGRNIAYSCSSDINAPTIMFTNSTGYLHAAPYGVAAYYNARVRTKNPKATVSVYNGPLPLTPHETQGIKAITNAIMALLITVPFSFIPSTFTGFIVKERESKAKLLQFVSGVGYGAYWSSNAIFDLLSFMITQILAIILFLAFGRSEYIGSGEAFIATFVLFTLYAMAAIPTAYVMSLAFRNHSTAQNAVLGIFFLAGFGLTLTGYLLKALDGPAFLIYIFRLFPPECLGEGLMAIANAPAAAQAGQPVNLWAMDQAGWPYLYLGLISLVMSSIILFVDHPERTKRQQMLSYSAYQTAPVPAGEPTDVANERRAVESSNDALLRVVGLRKEYPAPAGSAASVNVAVRNLTFQVPKGEIFGLLGTNGAGKTTSMNVITGECLPTMGHAYVAGSDVVEQAGEARQLIGYCPQFDALHDLMTVDEHLALYASLRGVLNPQVVSDALCTALGLSEYRKNKSMSLSGGNKRKLSVAIALLGAPKLLLLDEPTAGMDPVARRSMCDVVAAISMHCAVVLTTHHLEEVEALADRAAIMVGGAMQCLGTLEHLKQTLGAGYQVSIRLKDEIKAQACIDRLTREYPNQCKLLEQHLTKLNFNIKQGGRASIANLFEFLYKLKFESNDLGVVDYTVAQSSVEEVFLAVAGGTANEAVAAASDLEAASFVARQSSTHLGDDEKRGGATRTADEV